MQSHTTAWDRHAILAEIKRQYGSSRELARRVHLTAGQISIALGSPYPTVEKAVAGALGIPVQVLWPDRYWPNGRRRYGHTRPQISGASQNSQSAVDKGADR